MPRGSLKIILGFAFLAFTALGCTVCDSETSEQVRVSLFQKGLAQNLLATFSPFIIVGLLAALLHGGWRQRKGTQP